MARAFWKSGKDESNDLCCHLCILKGKADSKEKIISREEGRTSDANDQTRSSPERDEGREKNDLPQADLVAFRAMRSAIIFRSSTSSALAST